MPAQSKPIEPHARVCTIAGQTLLLIRRGAKNSRVCRIDATTKRPNGESFLVRTRQIESIATADSVWQFEQLERAQPQPSQTIRIDAEVAAQLHLLALQNGESLNDVLLRLLRLAEQASTQGTVIP
jgi:hypothetical protein